MLQLSTEAQQSRMNKETMEDVIREKGKVLSQMKHTLDKCQITIKVSSFLDSDS